MLQSKKIQNIIVYIFFHCMHMVTPLDIPKTFLLTMKSIFEHMLFEEASYGGYAKKVNKRMYKTIFNFILETSSRPTVDRT